jgi:hypothetical protein
VADPPGDDEAQRVTGREAYDIAEQIGPQSGRRGENHRVRTVELDVGHRVTPRPRGVEIFQRDELVEDPVVEHQRQAVAPLGLHGDEALGGGIDLDELEGALEALLEHAAIRPQRHAAVHEDPEVGPEIGQTGAPTAARHPLEQDQRPRRHARDQP